MTAPFKIITVEKVRPLFRAYIDSKENYTKVNVYHIANMLEHFSVIDDEAAFTAIYTAIGYGDMQGAELASYLLLMTPSQRVKLRRTV